jgi:hypothetical protein
MLCGRTQERRAPTSATPGSVAAYVLRDRSSASCFSPKPAIPRATGRTMVQLARRFVAVAAAPLAWPEPRNATAFSRRPATPLAGGVTMEPCAPSCAPPAPVRESANRPPCGATFFSRKPATPPARG